jgi:hypothetical protein
VARGRAGINDAHWDQNVTVKAGEKTEVKVSSVEASCADELQTSVRAIFGALLFHVFAPFSCPRKADKLNPQVIQLVQHFQKMANASS